MAKVTVLGTQCTNCGYPAATVTYLVNGARRVEHADSRVDTCELPPRPRARRTRKDT